MLNSASRCVAAAGGGGAACASRGAVKSVGAVPTSCAVLITSMDSLVLRCFRRFGADFSEARRLGALSS